MELAMNTMTADNRIGIQRAVRGTIRNLLGVQGGMPGFSREAIPSPEHRSSAKQAHRRSFPNADTLSFNRGEISEYAPILSLILMLGIGLIRQTGKSLSRLYQILVSHQASRATSDFKKKN